MFADDADMIAEGYEAETKMKRILKMHDDLNSATSGKIKEKKCELFTQRPAWKQGRQEIKNKVTEIAVNATKV